MEKDLVERYIRTKRKIRKIVTYKEDSYALRALHENALRFIRSSSYPSLFAKAYIPHRGIFENAKAHLYNDIFIKMDIKDFFNSIDHDQLAIQLHIELNKVSNIPISKEHVLISHCCHVFFYDFTVANILLFLCEYARSSVLCICSSLLRMPVLQNHHFQIENGGFLTFSSNLQRPKTAVGKILPEN